MLNLWKKLFSRKKKKSEHELFLDFMRTAKDRMTNKTESAMMKYLEEIYKFAVKSQKKEEKKKTKISTWISQDKAIEDKARREREAIENSLPHPGEHPI